MTKLGCLGCTLVGIGPCTVLFLFTIANNPLKVIIFTASGFFWLLSLLLTALLWMPLRSLTANLAPSLLMGVLFQEALRFSFYILINTADKGLRAISTGSQARPFRQSSVNSSNQNTVNLRQSEAHSWGSDRSQDNTSLLGNPTVRFHEKLLDHQIVAYVSGLGFGAMTCIVELLRTLIDSQGPGIYFDLWESKCFFIVAAFQASCLSVTQIFWSVILFSAFETRSYGSIALVFVVHVAMSCLSLANRFRSPWPEVICACYLLITICMGIFAYVAVRGKCRSFLRQAPNSPISRAAGDS
ncbi:unnamed protein product [Dicrocoelium dendriticum]|nr:unnamed protein product [Dicrocoelium dendriticum]